MPVGIKLVEDDRIGIIYTRMVEEVVSLQYESQNAHNERQQDQVLANRCRNNNR